MADKLVDLPSSLFAKYKIVLDIYVFDGKKIVGHFLHNFPFFVELDELTQRELDKIVSSGFIVDGFEEYSLNSLRVAAKSSYVEGYPEGSTTIDLGDRVYYKNKCVGRLASGNLVRLTDYDKGFLDGRGIDFEYKWIEPGQVELCVKAYKHGLYQVISDNLIVRNENEDVVLVGVLENEEVRPATPDEKNRGKKLGMKVV